MNKPERSDAKSIERVRGMLWATKVSPSPTDEKGQPLVSVNLIEHALDCRPGEECDHFAS